MKKILLLSILIVMTFTLFACDPYNVNSFREGDIVEMSSEDVATLLSTVNWEQEGEAFQIDVHADVDVSSESSYNSFGLTMESSLDLNVVFDSTTYIQYSDTIGDVAAHSESEVEFDYTNSNTYSTTSNTSSLSGQGSLNVYFYEGYLYVNPSIETTSGTTDIAFNGKEKLNEEVTQEMWDELQGELNSGLDTGGMTSVYSLPTELLSLLDEEHIAGLLDVFPLVTIYQKGTVTNIHFDINKALVVEHAEELVTYMYDVMEETGEEVGTPEQQAILIADTVSEIEDYMDYFETLSMTMDIVIDEGNLARYAMSLDVKTVDSALDEWGTSMDITITVEVNFGVNLPSFPNDLDEYTPVDNIGDSYDFSPFASSILIN